MVTENEVGAGSTKTVVELSIKDLRTVVSDIMKEERTKATEEAKRTKQGVEIYTRSEVAHLLNVSYPTLHRWNKIGYLIPVKAGRKVHYLKSDVENLLTK